MEKKLGYVVGGVRERIVYLETQNRLLREIIEANGLVGKAITPTMHEAETAAPPIHKTGGGNADPKKKQPTGSVQCEHCLYVWQPLICNHRRLQPSER